MASNTINEKKTKKTTRLMASLLKLARGSKTILDFNEARGDHVAVASAGPYENHLHQAVDT